MNWNRRYSREKNAGIADDAEKWLGNPIKIHREHLTTGFNGMEGHPSCLDRTCPVCPEIDKLQRENKTIHPLLRLQWENAHCPGCGSFSINGHSCDQCETPVPFHDPHVWTQALEHQKNCTGCNKHQKYHNYDPNKKSMLSGKYSRYCMGCGSPFQDGELDYGAEPFLDETRRQLWDTGKIREYMSLSHGSGTTDGGAAGFCRPCLFQSLPRVDTPIHFEKGDYIAHDGSSFHHEGGTLPQWTFDTTHRIPENYCRNCGKHVGEGNSCPDCPKEQQCSCKGGSLF